MTSRVGPVLLGAVALLSACVALFQTEARAARQNSRLLTELRQQRSVLEQLSERVQHVEGRSQTSALAVAPNAGLDPSSVAAEVARQVAASLDERASAAQANAKVESEPTPDNLLAFAAASRTLSRIVDSKHWTESDKSTMRRELSKVSPDQKAQLFQRMAIALNSGQVAVETRGPPL